MKNVLWWLLAGLLNEHGVTLNLATKTSWDASVPEYWDQAVMYESDRQAVTSRLSGPDGSDAPVIQNRDLTKQAGDQITFTSLQRLLGAGVSGTTALEGSEENLVNGTYAVTVELYRHATAANDIARKEVLWDFPTVAARRMSEWHARFRDDFLMNRVLNTDTIQTLYAGGKTSRANLGPADLFTTRELKRLHMAARRRGVNPFRTTRKAQMPWPTFGAFLSEVDYYNLTESDDFKQDMRYAAARGENNPALDGNTDMYQGITLWVFGAVNPGDGMLGSYLRPEARLAAALNSSATTFTIGPTTAVTNVDYGQYFPASGSGNVLLIDSEQITYTGGASDPGNASWGTVDRAENGTTAASHSAGALVTLNNNGKILLFGANFALEGWAMPVTRVRQERDYGMELGIGIKWIYGVKGVDNADNTLAHAVALESYSANPNTV